MIVVAFHQTARRVGTTTLAVSFCEIAREDMPRVAAVASGQSPEFEERVAESPQRFATATVSDGRLSASGQKIDLVPPREAQNASRYALAVLDVPAGHTPPIAPTVWVLPVSDPASLVAAVELTETLAGDVVWIGNRRHLTLADVPEHLRDRVRVAPSIRKCRAPAKLPPARWAVLRLPRRFHADRPLALRDALERLFDEIVPFKARRLLDRRSILRVVSPEQDHASPVYH